MTTFKPFPLIGHAPQILRKGLLNLIVDMCGDNSRPTRLLMGPQVTHVVSHPDHVRYVFSNTTNYIKGTTLKNLRLVLGEGLVTSDGELWRRERSLVQAAFQREKMAGLLALCVQPTEEMLSSWDRGPAAAVLDVHREIRRLVFVVSGLTLFGCDLRDSADEARHAFATALGAINDRNENQYALPLWMPTPGNIKLRKAVAILDRHVDGIIAQRRGNASGDDVLGILLRARNAGPDFLTDRQLRDEVITLYLAGHDATAHSLTWMFHILALYPNVQRRLREESFDVLGSRPPVFENLRYLHQTRMTIQESMRVWPAVPLLARQAVKDDKIGDCHIQAGTWVLPTAFLTHRMREFWPEPEKFDPERFSDENIRTRNPFAFYPFGGGPRTCIGNHVALAEVQLIVAMMLQKYAFEHLPGTTVTPIFRSTLHPKGGLELLRRRL